MFFTLSPENVRGISRPTLAVSTLTAVEVRPLVMISAAMLCGAGTTAPAGRAAAVSAITAAIPMSQRFTFVSAPGAMPYRNHSGAATGGCAF